MARRNNELKNLHPVCREKVQALLQRLGEENNPLRLFEGYRSPERQQHLYAQGRTIPNTRIVTKAKPWQSYHQYGIAADFVLYINNNWSWNTSGTNAQYWTRLHEIGREVGLRPLSWEKPHLQLADITLEDLRAGRYPAGGDSDWGENLEDAITSWSGRPVAPPVPTIMQERPPLEDSDDDDGAKIPAPSGGRTNSYRVIARRGLRLREGPGTEFDIIESLSYGQIVTRLSTNDEWFKIDVEGDGLADGFCYGAYLESID